MPDDETTGDTETTDELKIVTAPFTDDQVESLNGSQGVRMSHPFTCGSDRHDRHVNLVATPAGWVCPDEDCDYTQDWAYAFMADGSWRARQERWDSLFKR